MVLVAALLPSGALVCDLCLRLKPVRLGGRMSFEALKARQADVWSSAPFELVAATAADIHERVLDAVAVQPGERLLDLATGTGAVAIRAAQRGARVTGQDLAPGLIETARRLAADAGVEVKFEVGDCERLPYPDGAFDVVCSAQGAVFAPDHQAVAGEIARACRSGGRLGLTAWRPGGAIAGFFRVLASFQPPPPEGAGAPLDWGRPEYVAGLLGDAFELNFEEGESPQVGELSRPGESGHSQNWEAQGHGTSEQVQRGAA